MMQVLVLLIIVVVAITCGAPLAYDTYCPATIHILYPPCDPDMLIEEMRGLREESYKHSTFDFFSDPCAMDDDAIDAWRHYLMDLPREIVPYIPSYWQMQYGVYQYWIPRRSYIWRRRNTCALDAIAAHEDGEEEPIYSEWYHYPSKVMPLL